MKDSSKLDKGKAFGAEEPFNGLYLNGARARNNLGGLLMLVKSAQVLNYIEEASLQLGVDEKGGFLKFILDLEPNSKADAKADDAKAEPAEAPPAQ